MIADASARIGESSVVPLDDYANPSAEAGTDVAREPVAGRSLTR
jgi:hypothetical protein